MPSHPRGSPFRNPINPKTPEDRPDTKYLHLIRTSNASQDLSYSFVHAYSLSACGVRPFIIGVISTVTVLHAHAVLPLHAGLTRLAWLAHMTLHSHHAHLLLHR
jgi:hypothetical protein